MISFLSQQLLYAGPALLIVAGGFLAAIAYYKRAPAAARLVLAGCVLYGLSALGGALASALVIQANDNGALEPNGLSLWMSIVGVIRSLSSALSYALWLAAAFVGRPAAD